MAKRKTKRPLRKTSKNFLVTTTTKVGHDNLRVTIRRRRDIFWLMASLVPRPDQKNRDLTRPLIQWTCRFSEKQADIFVWSLAVVLGYEVAAGHAPLKDVDLYVLNVRKRLLDIRLYLHHKGPDARIVVSRVGAQKILEALAKELDWKLTG